MEKDDEKSRLETAESDLNSRQFEEKEIHTELEKPDFEVAQEWDVPDQEGKKNTDAAAEVSKYFAQKKGSLMKYILIVSFLFFIGAFAFAALTMWRGSNISSPSNVDISIDGPSSVDGGKETILQIVVKNKNTVALSDVELFLEFPRSIEVLGVELDNQRLTIPIGKLDEGGIANETIKVVFWGEEKEQKIITGQLEYRFEGSNAELKKNAEYVVDILSSPIHLTVDMLKEATSRQEMELRIMVSSEMDDTTENALLEVDYPNGFTFSESTPEPSFGDNRWRLGSLDKFRDKEVVIRGVIVGENTEEKTFQTTVGTQDSSDEKEIDVILNRIVKEVTLVQPFIGLTFATEDNDKLGFRPVKGGIRHTLDLQWINNDESKVIDLELEVKISGDFSPDETMARRGFFRSTDNTAVWDQKTYDKFAVVEGKESGSVYLSIEPKPALSRDGVLTINPEVLLEANARGRRISDLNVPQETGAPLVQYLRVITEADLIARTVRNIGPFQNTGPIPPVANQATTYTVIWQITNTSNDLEDVVVQTKLPTYVDWMGVYTPRSEDVTYDEVSGDVIWTIPRVPAGTGVTGDTRELAFQIRLVPSVTQVGRKVDLTGETLMYGTDSFTLVEIEDEERKLNTETDSDPYYNHDDGEVVAE